MLQFHFWMFNARRIQGTSRRSHSFWIAAAAMMNGDIQVCEWQITVGMKFRIPQLNTRKTFSAREEINE